MVKHKEHLKVLGFLASGEYRKDCECKHCKKVPKAFSFAVQAIKENQKLREALEEIEGHQYGCNDIYI